ncbi:hypothetical protein [Bradyrhizobium sp. ORS 111]|uniref:hypothetical protein n=1 Tax=Bradyrhizobium sp. ORS 111 TaxID=1685958 RepID=UPI00388D8203
MKLLRSGMDLLTIQAWLGHAQVATHRYAAADVEMMRRGLEKAGVSGDRSARFRPNHPAAAGQHSIIMWRRNPAVGRPWLALGRLRHIISSDK